ncbi:MAG TPA: DUF4377 domain-containing protein [Longimicrobiaceae bacterium]|nr:DUF4377 domain-containing protein [Longimicrobiaceae bacterium]
MPRSLIPAFVRRRFRLLTLCLGVAALLPGCDALLPTGEELLTLYVAPYRRECVTIVVHQCLLVREEPDEPWQLFYDGIEGFTHQPGFAYKLLVLRQRVENPPADGSSLRWRLVRVLEKVPSAESPA